MNRPTRRAPWLTLFVALAACGQSTGPSTEGGTDASPGPASPCPTTEPAGGSPCTRANLTCEYGADPRRECRDEVTCNGATWVISAGGTSPAGRANCASPSTTTCPATMDALTGQACAMGAVCSYAGRQCECTPCFEAPIVGCGATPMWQCDALPAAGCPASTPRYGEPCTQEGQQCEYGCNSTDGAVACTGGVWQPGSDGMCPVSTRRVKRDIAYVSPRDADALAAELRSTRLATYEYTLPSMAGRRHLGFIIEDQPAASYAVDPVNSRVDLYGYASLLVATVQSQDRTIAALSARLDALERRVTRARPGPAARAPATHRSDGAAPRAR